MRVIFHLFVGWTKEHPLKNHQSSETLSRRGGEMGVGGSDEHVIDLNILHQDTPTVNPVLPTDHLRSRA